MLNESTVRLAEHCEVVCIFVNDNGSRKVLEKLAALGVKIVALRCAGFNNVDLKAAQELGIKLSAFQLIRLKRWRNIPSV